MAIDVLVGTGELSHGAVLFDSRTRETFGPVFDNEADARGFLEWYGDGPWHMRRHLESSVTTWREVRDWPSCSCGESKSRVEPGHEVCDDCECDEEYEAEQAAKGKG